MNKISEEVLEKIIKVTTIQSIGENQYKKLLKNRKGEIRNE